MRLTDEERRARKRAQMRAWRKANPELARERDAKWYRANLQKSRERHRASAAKWIKAHPERAREQRMRSDAKWRKAHPEYRRDKSRVYRAVLRAAVHRAYGGACVCCGETTPQFLQVDHAFGDGRKHREQVGGTSIYRWLEKNGFPQNGFRLLCCNCNFALGVFGACPHGGVRILNAPDGETVEPSAQLRLVLE